MIWHNSGGSATNRNPLTENGELHLQGRRPELVTGNAGVVPAVRPRDGGDGQGVHQPRAGVGLHDGEPLHGAVYLLVVTLLPDNRYGLVSPGIADQHGTAPHHTTSIHRLHFKVDRN